MHIVVRLCALFAMDSFAGAFVMQTWIAAWFYHRWGFSEDLVGYLLMGANIVAGISGICAAHFVKRFGAMLTMVATHLPSNVLLLSVPLMPSGLAAALMLVARFSISQMDVPARQAYVQMVVASDERSAAGGITNLVRSLGMSLAPLLVGYMTPTPGSSNVGMLTIFSLPWIISGLLKIVYDLLLYGLYLSDPKLRHGEANAAAADKKESKAAAEVNELKQSLLGGEEPKGP
jgi:MFS family permease